MSCSQGLGAAAKKPRGEQDEAAESAARAREFMQEFAALPLDKLEPEEAIAQAQALYKQLLADTGAMPTLQRLLEG